MENWAFAISPLVFAVGSQLGALCAASGDTLATPIDTAAAIRLRIAFIRDLLDLSIKKRGWVGGLKCTFNIPISILRSCYARRATEAPACFTNCRAWRTCAS